MSVWCPEAPRSKMSWTHVVVGPLTPKMSEKLLENVIQHDVSLPLNNIENFIFESSKALKKFNPNISIINFGHLGDNNLHFNVCIDDKLNKKNYSNFKKKVNEIIFSFVNKFNGSKDCSSPSPSNETISSMRIYHLALH